MLEENMFVAYTPALDLSTCGKTFEEANRNLREAIMIVIEEAIKDDKLEQMLIYYGWKEVVKGNERHLRPPAVVAHTTQAIHMP